MTAEAPSRTIIISADNRPFPVVFEMGGQTVFVEAGGHLRLVLRGPETQTLEIGHGANGLSIFRDEHLEVEVYDFDGALVQLTGFA